MDKLTMLMAELNMHAAPAGRAEQLRQLLTVAASQIEQKGIHLAEDDVKDAYLQVSYAAWLYRRRAQTDSAMMPRYLRMDIHDRLIAEKGRVQDGS